MNLIETLPIEPLPGASAAAETSGAVEAALTQPDSSAAPAASDIVASGQAAVVALAYSAYALAGRNSVANPSRMSSEAARDERDEASASSFGPSVALIRAAVPSALQGQFVAQLTAAYGGGAAGGDPAAEEGNMALSDHDLAKLVAAGRTGQDDASVSSLISRLARDVARYGAAPVAQALHLTHDAPVLAAAAGTPHDTQVGGRAVRRQGEREQRRERRQQRDERDEADGRDDGNPSYTIDDVVRIGDKTVATHRMVAPPLNLERNST